MKTSYLALGLGAFLGLAILTDYLLTDATDVRVPAGPVALDCNRSCLAGVVDQFLDALVANDPAALPLSADVRYSENAQMLDVGDGLWLTTTARGNYGHYFADPDAGQAGFMGTIEAGGRLQLLSLRIRIQLGRITEIETSSYQEELSGTTGIAALDATGEPATLWHDEIPLSERLSRQEMIAVANAYFEGLEQNNGQGYTPFSNDCRRIQNGEAVSDAETEPRPDGFDLNVLGCQEQFESGYYASVTNVHQRRFPLVDQERGVVWGYAVVDHDGTVFEVIPGVDEFVPTEAFFPPSSFHAIGAFLIEGGLIRRVEMIETSIPYHANSPWEGGLSGE